LERELLISKVFPALIFFSLWLDGWFYPLILLPFLYVLLVEKKDVQWLGFRMQKFKSSISLGLLTSIILSVMHYLLFLHYPSLVTSPVSSLYNVFVDVVWYPFYEEFAYRGFFLVHFAVLDGSNLSKRNLFVNLVQSFLFLSIHGHHVASGKPFLLVLVLLLAFLNGFIFVRTRNIFGCLLSHCTVNSFAWLLQSM